MNVFVFMFLYMYFHYSFYLGPEFHQLVVTSIESVTHDTKLLTLAIPVGKDLTVPPGQHIKIRASIKGIHYCTCMILYTRTCISTEIRVRLG